MAIRRSFIEGREDDQNIGMDDYEGRGPVGIRPVDMGDGSGTGANVDEFGNVLPDFSNDPNFPTPFVDYTPDEIAGNKDTPTQTFQPQQPRTSAPANPVGGISMDEIMSLLPQGVEAQPSAEASGMGAGSVPGLPSEPSPQVMRHMPPAMSQSEGNGSMPARAPFSSPSAMFGRGGEQGLGRIGGFSLPGQNQGGPQATKAMLELLRQLEGVV